MIKNKRLHALVLSLCLIGAVYGDPSKEVTYLNNLLSQKASCLAKIDKSKTLQSKEHLAGCYKTILVGLVEKFYPSDHFGKELEQEITRAMVHQRDVLQKITHCPRSKKEGCGFYEDYDAASGLVDYMSELIEFTALNIGEGTADFHPEQWLKQWDAVK